jgi:hypothetical protein
MRPDGGPASPERELTVNMISDPGVVTSVILQTVQATI